MKKYIVGRGTGAVRLPGMNMQLPGYQVEALVRELEARPHTAALLQYVQRESVTPEQRQALWQEIATVAARLRSMEVE